MDVDEICLFGAALLVFNAISVAVLIARCRRLESLLRGCGAPEAPCERCRDWCFGSCQCGCHQERIAWHREQMRQLGLGEDGPAAGQEE